MTFCIIRISVQWNEEILAVQSICTFCAIKSCWNLTWKNCCARSSLFYRLSVQIWLHLMKIILNLNCKWLDKRYFARARHAVHECPEIQSNNFSEEIKFYFIDLKNLFICFVYEVTTKNFKSKHVTLLINYEKLYICANEISMICALHIPMVRVTSYISLSSLFFIKRNILQ